MPVTTPRTDDELLSSPDPDAFGVFYDRHVKSLLGYFARRTRDPEVAADLTAETFASALVARRRFKPGGAPAAAWLFAIAARRLADYQRRGRVEQRMRRSLEMERRVVSDADAVMIRLLGDDAAESMLAELPPEQRELITGHVIEERPYDELAGELQTSEAAVRQRVSRTLGALRRRKGTRG
jgi:RNA polymerase sigma-70 factor (ECF subfamily)